MVWTDKKCGFPIAVEWWDQIVQIKTQGKTAFQILRVAYCSRFQYIIGSQALLIQKLCISFVPWKVHLYYKIDGNRATPGENTCLPSEEHFWPVAGVISHQKNISGLYLVVFPACIWCYFWPVPGAIKYVSRDNRTRKFRYGIHVKLCKSDFYRYWMGPCQRMVTDQVPKCAPI